MFVYLLLPECEEGEGKGKEKGTGMVPKKSPPVLAECSKEHCSPLFADLSVEEFGELQGLMVPIDYEAGELIQQEGMPSNGVYVICQGLVKLGRHTADRERRRLLQILGPREVLGLESLFCKRECFISNFAKAIVETRVAFIERDRFLDFLGRHPEVSRRICEHLSREIISYQCHLTEMAYEPIQVNLARLLLLLARRFGTRRGKTIELEFSRSDLAELLGTHADTIVRTLAHFKEKGLVATRYHQIAILDEAGLEALASPFPLCLTEDFLRSE